ncbi:hypothetical protein GGQ84_000995 [Desulfitispora alkaliphila]|uniref:aryl-sulfate sulfotransferase n=1 Tax=Desulfitispora alkaliphila TaxID=622674 RepID=UPI003D1B2F23
MTYPSVYPTGVTVYNPDKSWNGYTIFQARELGALLIDMNGAEVQLWKGLDGFPNKLLPGGYVMGHTGERNNAFGMQDRRDLVQVDWEGNIVWKFNQYEFIEDPGEEPQWMCRQHHDYQREGNPVGYYTPGMNPQVDKGNTLILCHKNVKNPKISDKLLLDDTIIEVTWDGDIVWEWVCNEHFDEYGFGEAAKNILARDPNMRSAGGGMGDWMHINSMSVLGPNKWYDAGDERFHPDNIIWDGRETNIIAIISKKTGNVVWKIGPDYDTSKELKELGWIIGPHHAHMIPRGVPGEGNILVFDNGGWGGYGLPNPCSPTGRLNALRDYSRVLEIDPVTLKIVWQYTPTEAGYLHPVDSNRFYSPFISGAQRLPNGNTLITEGSGGRIIEVTPDHELVWEYISPYWGKHMKINMVYRAYRVPYQWVPQLEQPQETPIEPIDVKTFRVPGAAPIGRKKETEVDGVIPYQGDTALCVMAGEEDDE